MEKYKISVIVPVYNVEKYLIECLNSIIHQTYYNLEIILVDDGSTDRSGEICDEYKAVDSRIKVIHKNNNGVSEARNDGLAISTGDYITFIDSDDYISNDYLEKLMLVGNYDVIIANGISNVDENSNILFQKIFIKNNVILNDVINFEILYELVRSSIFGYSIGKLYNRRIINDVKYETIPFSREDLIFNISLISRMRKVAVVKNNGYYYRQRSNSLLHANYHKEVPNVNYVGNKLIIDNPTFIKTQNIKISGIILKNYMVDVIHFCIIKNEILDENQKIEEIKKILSCRVFKDYLKFQIHDNKAFQLLSICFSLNIPKVYYFILKRLIR